MENQNTFPPSELHKKNKQQCDLELQEDQCSNGLIRQGIYTPSGHGSYQAKQMTLRRPVVVLTLFIAHSLGDAFYSFPNVSEIVTMVFFIL